MTSEEVITQLTAMKGQHENNALMLGMALDLVKDGYKSDQDLIAQRVSEKLAEAVKEATAPLQARIDELSP